MKFTERFNELLKYEGINQNKLSLYLGISRQAVTDYKKGRNFPSLEIFYRMCVYFDVSSDYLLGLTD